jgi:protein-tyrosine phosphatase
MLDTMTRHLPLGGTYNVRDLGGYRTEAGDTTRWRSVLRADSLHRLDPAGKKALLDAGLATVIDLRFPNEKGTAPQPFRSEPGVEVVDVVLFANLDAAHIRGAAEGDLLGLLYQAALASCGSEIRDVLGAVADAEQGLVLFHCTAGKDRTGVIAALLLLAADVPAETIADDYALTATFAAPLFEELLLDMVARGQSRKQAMRYLAAERETMLETLAHLDGRYGGIKGYLERLGLGESKTARLRNRLLAA